MEPVSTDEARSRDEPAGLRHRVAEPDAAEQAAQILQQVMEQAGQRYLRKVPVKAEVAIALNWAEK